MATSGKKILLGCLIGCGSVLVLAVGSCVGFVVWLNRPGEQLDPGRLRHPGTTAYVEWTLRLDDPGMARVVERGLELAERARTRSAEGVPGFVQLWLQRRDEARLRRLFPVVLVWSLRTGDAERPALHLVTVNVKQLGNQLVFADWVLSLVARGQDDDIDGLRHGRETIYVLRPQGIAFFMRSGQFFFTSDPETARLAVDGLDGAMTVIGEPSQLDRWLADVPEASALRGAATNEHGEVGRIFGWLTGNTTGPAEPAWDWQDVSGLTLRGEFTESAAFAAELAVLLRDPGWAERHGERLVQLLVSTVDVEGLDVRTEHEVLDDRLVVKMHIDDLPAALERMLPDQ